MLSNDLINFKSDDFEMSQKQGEVKAKIYYEQDSSKPNRVSSKNYIYLKLSEHEVSVITAKITSDNRNYLNSYYCVDYNSQFFGG